MTEPVKPSPEPDAEVASGSGKAAAPLASPERSAGTGGVGTQ